MRSITKHRAGIPPFDVLQKILATNPEAPASQAEPTDRGPWITWLADADPRLQPFHILPDPTKKLFAVRNLGNQLAVSTGTVDFGIRYLHTPVLLITAPGDSRAVEFFLEGHGELALEIRQDIDHLYLALIDTRQKKTTKKQPVGLLDFVEANIDYQVKQAVIRYGDRLKTGRLVVVGAILDLDNDYGRGRNRLIVININGETAGKKLRKARITKKLDKKLLRFVGRERDKKTDKNP